MQWTWLNHFDQPAWLSKEAAAMCAELNQRIDKLKADREAEDKRRQQMQHVDLATVSADVLFQADCPQHNLFQLLQQELKLREDFWRYFELEGQARRVEAERAIQAHIAAEADLTAKLVSIGYVDTKDGSVQGRIQPLFILTHPVVRRAKAYMDELRFDSTARQTANEDAIGVVKQAMQRLKERAVG